MYDPKTKRQSATLLSKESVSSGSDNAKIAGENKVDYFFFPATHIYHEFVPEKQIVNGTRRLIARVHRFGSVFQEIQSRHLLLDNAPADSSGVVSQSLAVVQFGILCPADTPVS
jgi:hypothetical protein